MPTSFQFNSTQLAEIERLRNIADRPENKQLAGGGVDLYAYIFQCVTGLDPRTTPWPDLQWVFSGASGSEGVQFSEEIQRSLSWLYGAFQVNSDQGAFSQVIREYNIRQGELRGKDAFSKQQLDEASNAVAVLFANSILSSTDASYQRLPSIQEIGSADLNGVRNVLYPGNETPGSELYLNQAWPGIVMLGALGGQYTDRLLRFDDNNEAIAIDTLGDFKAMLFAWDSFKIAFEKTPLSATTIPDILTVFHWPLSLIGVAVNEFLANGATSLAQFVFSTLAASQNPQAKVGLDLIAELDSPKFLDLLMGTLQGKTLLGTTTEANFASKAKAFFDDYPTSKLQSFGITLLSESEISTLESRAKTDFGAFLALQALSPLVATGEQTLADLKQTHSTLAAEWQADMNGRLYGDQDYPYTFTEQWYEDRTRLLIALEKGDFEKTGWVNDAAAPADRDLVFHYFVDGQPVENILGFSRDGTPRADQEVFFGTDGNDPLNGSPNTVFGDRIYGGAGNDTINGLDGADYIEGNTGNDSLNGGEGHDKVLGGAGDDTLDGGAGNDSLLGGAGTDRYEFSGSFGEDLVIDSDGTGTVWINSVQMRGGKKIAGLSNSFISDDKLWRYELGSNGDLLIRRADGSAGSVMLRGWQNGGGNRLDITLGDEPAPVTPAPTVRTYFGDQAAPLTTNTNNEPNFEPTYDWGKTTWLEDGTLDGGLVQNNFADVIKAHLIAPNTDSRIFGYGGNDALGGGDGNDEISGGDGDDLIAGGKGSNELRGGAGNDFISATGYITAGQRVRPGEIWTAPSGATVLGSGPTWGVYESASGEQTWFGISTIPSDVTVGSVIDAGDGNDQALGSWAGDTIYMGANNDVAEGLAGRDVIYGEGGHDTLFGDGIETPGKLNSTPGEQHGDDLIDGGTGNDSISGQGGSDVLLGGGDDDLLEGDGDVRAQFHGEDLLDGGQGDDELVGGGLSDQLLGGQDDDILWGDNNHASALDGARHGDDILWGEAGNDSLIGGGGKDTLLGGDNNDVLFGDDISTVRGGYVVEAKYHGADELFGGAGDDQLVGGGGADRLYGQGDNDYLYGDGQQLAASAHGDDYLDGGDGNDYLFGEGGNDTLDGGSGSNWLEGGAGDDTYIVRTAEVSSPTPEPDQPLLLNTVIKDSQGKNRVRIDATSTGFGIVQGSGSVGLTWSGAQAGTTAGIFFEDYASVGTFTLEFSDGQALALSRLVGDTLESSVSFSSDAEYGAVVGGKSNDTLSANGSHSTLSGGQGNDQLIVNGSESTILYDRGDGRDTVSGYGNAVLISFGFSFADEHILNLVMRSLSNPRLQVFVCCFNVTEHASMEQKFKGHRNVKCLVLDDGVMNFTAFNEKVLTWPDAADAPDATPPAPELAAAAGGTGVPA